jgi:DNA polymerase-4
MERAIVHLDLDTFFVSVERLMDSSLQNQPVIIGGSSDRGVVASCSYEARQFGVYAAMPIRLARQLCPQAIFRQGDMDAYSKHSGLVTEIIAEQAPFYEKASIDEHYIDLTGMEKFFGSVKWAAGLRKRIIKETGLPISLGLSVNKTVSKIATGEAKPNGEKQVPCGDEKAFLAPLSIRKIPMVGPKTYVLLRQMGIEKVRNIQEMPVEMMGRAFGENGISIWKKAQGIDNAPVEPYTERKSISTETTFPVDSMDLQLLQHTLVCMVDQLAYQLRQEGKVTSCVVVKIRYTNFDTHTMQSKITYTSADHLLAATVKELFQKLYTRRMLVRLIGIKFTGLVGGHHQIHLFDASASMINLYQAMDKIRNRFGDKAVVRSVGL